MTPVAILAKSGICNLGTCWPEIWGNLLEGKRNVVPHRDIEKRVPLDVHIAAIASLDRRLDPKRPGVGAACRLASQVLKQLEPRESDKLFGSSNHTETDAILEIAGRDAGNPAWELLGAIDRDPMPVWTSELANMHFGETTWCYSACASANHSLALAASELQSGRITTATVLAADAQSALAVAGFSRIGATTTSGIPPLCEGSDGILIGEGAAAIHLALADAPGQICLLGFGMTCDAAHQVHPDPDGTQLERGIRKALDMAELPTSRIDVVIAHGTGTEANDRVEARVLNKVFGCGEVAVTSIKGAIGHCMGASGLFNTALATAVVEHGILPPTGTAHYLPIDGLDLILGEPRQVGVSPLVLCISSGFGGNHCVTVVGRAT